MVGPFLFSVCMLHHKQTQLVSLIVTQVKQSFTKLTDADLLTPTYSLIWKSIQERTQPHHPLLLGCCNDSYRKTRGDLSSDN